MPRATGHQRVQEDCSGHPIGGQGGTGVEPEPAEPQQADTEQHERQVVRAHGVLLETDAGAEHQSQSKRRHAGDDFDDHAARVVQRTKLEQPAARSPHPVGHHRIHRDRPHRDEDHPGGELGTVRDGTADQCSGDDCEAQLEGGEQ